MGGIARGLATVARLSDMNTRVHCLALEGHASPRTSPLGQKAPDAKALRQRVGRQVRSDR
jgi:hypothetical protein